ncbi:MAG: hypothetical protein IJB11_06120 [Oscillospiraceae bacterium]|nr:hypothetical protein [Oscillospiraceae bacterium]
MKQNMRKKALLPAISMVLAAIIALSGVTYAWFTTGNTASVTGLDVNIQTANGIQVSLDASAWRSIITAKDIQDSITRVGGTYSGSANQYPTTEIAPVSSAGNVVDGKLQMFYGEIAKDGTLLSKAEAEEERVSAGNFIAFDLFFKSSSTQMLTLNIGDSLSFVKGASINGSNDQAGAEKAVRVAFVPLGSAATPEAARALKDGSTALIWEPNADSRAAGVEADTGKLPYNGFNTEFESKTEAQLLDDGVVSHVTTFTGTTDIVELQAGINKVRVYIWLEGQDVDCVNQISFGDFTANLSFSVPEVE